jgi:RNA polymerase sigma-70 factor (ECF subfamily)
LAREGTPAGIDLEVIVLREEERAAQRPARPVRIRARHNSTPAAAGPASADTATADPASSGAATSGAATSGAASSAPDILAELIIAAQHGDEQAFEGLYRLVQPGLLRYLVVLVGRDAEDVASETWAQICRDLPSFDGTAKGGAGFRAWAATIGRHRALDQIRATGRRPADPVPIEELLDIQAQQDTELLAEEALSTEAALRLITTLPREQAEAVLLRTVMGLDARSAGQVLRRQPGAVRTAAHRGLAALAAKLSPESMTLSEDR